MIHPFQKLPAVATQARRRFALDRTFTHRLHTLSKLTDRATQAGYVAELGIPLGEGRCLVAIGESSALSVNDLAQRANLNKGQASRAAQSLVSQGFARKETSATDGRGVVLTLTPKGERMWAQAVELVERRNKQILSCLSAQEREQLLALLDKLVVHARATGAGSEDGDDLG